MRPYKILGETRDWAPGDGLSCGHSAKAPVEMPCGRPVKTNVRQQSTRPGGPTRTVVTPLCSNHSMVGMAPGALMTQARREAHEKLAADHWDEFQRNLQEAIARLVEEAS